MRLEDVLPAEVGEPELADWWIRSVTPGDLGLEDRCCCISSVSSAMSCELHLRIGCSACGVTTTMLQLRAATTVAVCGCPVRNDISPRIWPSVATEISVPKVCGSTLPWEVGGASTTVPDASRKIFTSPEWMM